MRTLIAACAIIVMSAQMARADVVWVMNWMKGPPQAGCIPTRSEQIGQERDAVLKMVPGTALKTESFTDGNVNIVRVSAQFPNGNRSQSVYVSDYGYCLAMFYEFRDDSMRYIAGAPLQIGDHN
jgi:hypothetical protein